MATPTKEGPNTVSLDGLLNSLGGVEGSIMSRPKSMNTMKKNQDISEAHVSGENASTRVQEDRREEAVCLQEEPGVQLFDVEALLHQEAREEEYDTSGDRFETISLGDHSGHDDLLQGVFHSTEDVTPLRGLVAERDAVCDVPVMATEDTVETVPKNSLPVFDCLDEKMGKYPTVEKHDENVLDRGREENHHDGGHAESHDHATVSEIGHKAAKALQIGKNWLFNTSKNIARDVQSRIDARASRRKHRRQRSIIEYPMSDFVPEEHHRLWAEQLRDAPPETQVAALEAMEDYDRLAVQHVIDEMIWYDNHHAASRQGREEVDPKTPDEVLPSYNDVVPEQNTEQHGTSMEETFDLLNLHSGQEQVVEAQRNTDWEGTLFGSSKSHTESCSNVRQSTLVGDEPEIRRKLRDQRIAREEQRVKEQVANMRDAEARETSEKEEKVLIRNKLRPEIDAWSAGKKDNIRSLLCTMDKVMWEGSTWKSPSVADVIEPPKVRKWYMKANLVVHPDKVKQNHGTLEQLTRAEMIFDVLQHAWAKFS